MYKFTKFDKANMQMAYITANLSYCQRRQVGAVIVRDDRVIANGVNGTSKGTENICEDKYVVCGVCNKKVILSKPMKKYKFKTYANQERIKSVYNKVVEEDKQRAKDAYYVECHDVKCDTLIIFKEEHIELTTNDKVIHAEQNAILFAARNGISINGTTMFVTTEPCIDCAKFIEASGIKKVIYRELYKNNAGVEYLQNNGVECYRYDVLDLQNGK